MWRGSRLKMNKSLSTGSSVRTQAELNFEVCRHVEVGKEGNSRKNNVKRH